ncbi:MAG: ABC transporter ATP-binding protein [Bacteroides sp.]|nr:ABC transporter ATP-binding protein [Bacteroides sp.]MCM1413332.1 ABC transporter ATP-binding protein [Bacteroides sp.]MCM1471982.1 ABC transporter ATP-binding protein [Bacteroides sp.]
MSNILEIEDVSKSFGSHRALDHVSINVPTGKVYGLLGPNGAGKTTLIRIINHITAPDSGRVMFDGKQLTQDDVAHIGYLPEERGLYKKMKVGEQALFFARLKGLSRQQAIAELKHWFDRFEIGDWWNRKVEELSKGMAQKVQFIVTVLHRPKLLIFDEPFSGFDPINANLLRDEILNLKNQGATVIFSTHNMSSVEEICDNITLINHGQNILTGNVDELRREFTKGKYSIEFEGSGYDLVKEVETMLKAYDLTQLPNGRNRINLALNDDTTAKQLVAAANEAVDIVAFNPAIASMNDIFISTVKSSETTTGNANQL